MKDGYHVHSSTFCIICNGNTRLYYFYNTLIKFDLLKSAGSEMTPNTGHGVSSDGSHIAETSPRKRDKRGSNRKSGGEFAGSESIDEVRIFQTEEQKALVEKKVKIAEATEKKVRDETIKVREETTRTLIDELEAATRKVDEFQGE
mmetsp:Transcript_4886/g.11513  ORF Transcript_4886/g.11513 Transcript_4886/m.11513 type:complete len:146 (-) Transcript_4886:277-714(-)